MRPLLQVSYVHDFTSNPFSACSPLSFSNSAGKGQKNNWSLEKQFAEYLSFFLAHVWLYLFVFLGNLAKLNNYPIRASYTFSEQVIVQFLVQGIFLCSWHQELKLDPILDGKSSHAVSLSVWPALLYKSGAVLKFLLPCEVLLCFLAPGKFRCNIVGCHTTKVCFILLSPLK